MATEFDWSTTWENETGERVLPIPGHEVCGTIEEVGRTPEGSVLNEEVGPSVAGVSVGQEVYGLIAFNRDGAEAEYAIALSSEVAPKPATISAAQAAAVPISGLTAWQALFEHAETQEGTRVLIHGAAGGVGTFAVPLARRAGAHVIATTSTANVPYVRDLGADIVVDHTLTAFESIAKDVDVVLDAAGGETLERSWQVLARGGVLVSIVEPPSQAEAAKHGVRAEYFIVRPDRDQLMWLAGLIDAGHLRPFLDEIVPLVEARRAYEKRLRPHVVGRTVLRVNT
jgi:NADPH:quinone reductase-like Zn-dependent oxidoreductase